MQYLYFNLIILCYIVLIMIDLNMLRVQIYLYIENIVRYVHFKVDLTVKMKAIR